MRGESSHLARHRRRSQPERLTFRLRCGHMISFGTGDVRRHTSACRGSIYMDRAMPEPIARALVRGLVLSLSPGRFVLVHSVQLHFQRSWRIVVAWCCNRHHKSALAVSSARLTLSGRCRL
jgi:hypothetical protein